MIKLMMESGESVKKINMAEKYYPLEKYLRELPGSQDEVTLTFERIEEILGDRARLFESSAVRQTPPLTMRATRADLGAGTLGQERGEPAHQLVVSVVAGGHGENRSAAEQIRAAVGSDRHGEHA